MLDHFEDFRINTEKSPNGNLRKSLENVSRIKKENKN